MLRLAPVLTVAAASALVPALLLAQSRPDFGTAGDSYVRLAGADFAQTGGVAPKVFVSFGFNFLTYVLQMTPPVTGSSVVATLHLPGGSILDSIQLNSCDTTDRMGHVALTVTECDNFGICNHSPWAQLSSSANTNQCDAVSVSGINYTVDNLSRTLVVALQFDSPDNLLYGVIAGYKLQVSPPPATATFNDVPTDHPFFQFIEALAASGITGGCGNGSYCPDSPVTRGQMAVFLSKALGLYWSQ